MEQDDRVITRFRTRKAGVLLAYLAFYGQQAHSREVLRELLWPEQDPEETRHKLRQALSTLRHQLESPDVPSGTLILTDRATVQLNPAAFTTDVAEFESALQVADRAGSGVERSQRLIEAVQRYGGELLPGSFEGWILVERQRLDEQFHRALRKLIRSQEQSGNLEAAIEWARRAVRADPLREEAQQELIRLLTTAGEREAALRQYRELERLLGRELGEAPTEATRHLVDAPVPPPAGDAPDVHPRPPASGETDGEGGTWERTAAAEPGAFSSASGLSPFAVAPAVAPAPPTGTVTFLLTDIEGSTALWERTGSVFRTALASHHSLLREEFRRHGGYEVKEAGDSFVVAFVGAGNAAACGVLSGPGRARRAGAARARPEDLDRASAGRRG